MEGLGEFRAEMSIVGMVVKVGEVEVEGWILR